MSRRGSASAGRMGRPPAAPSPEEVVWSRSIRPTPASWPTPTPPSRRCARSARCTTTRCSAPPSRCRTRRARNCSAAGSWAGSGPTPSRPADFPAFNLLHRNSLLEREGPSHARLRGLVAGAFNRGHTDTARAVGARAGRPPGRRARRADPGRGSCGPHRGGGSAAAGRGDRGAARRCPSRPAPPCAAGRTRSSPCTSRTPVGSGGRRPSGPPPSSSRRCANSRRIAARTRVRRPGHGPAGRGPRRPTRWSVPPRCCSWPGTRPPST